jgi:hypothetical protein
MSNHFSNAVASVWEEAVGDVHIASTDAQNAREAALYHPAQDEDTNTVTVVSTDRDHSESRGNAITEKFGRGFVVNGERQRYDGQPYVSPGRELVEDMSDHGKREREFAAMVPDFDAVTTSAQAQRIPPHVARQMSKLPNSAEVFYFVAKEPWLIDVLRSVGPADAVRTLADVSDYIARREPENVSQSDYRQLRDARGRFTKQR